MPASPAQALSRPVMAFSPTPSQAQTVAPWRERLRLGVGLQQARRSGWASSLSCSSGAIQAWALTSPVSSMAWLLALARGFQVARGATGRGASR